MGGTRAPRTFGVVGLGRMGAGIASRLMARGYGVVAYDTDPAAVEALAVNGTRGARSLADLANLLPDPAVVWVMVPAGAATEAVTMGPDGLRAHIRAGGVVIDGGNSHFRDSVRRAGELAEQGIALLDCGTSGGLGGAREGYCLMVGGDPEAYALAEPLLAAIAQPQGYAHVGPSGAGHYVKMAHNAIEYGILEALGEGFELLQSGPCQYDLAAVADLWNHGSVIRSWLMELAADALGRDPRLEAITGAVGGGDTGSWAVEEAWSAGIPLPGIALAYAMRLRSRQTDTFSGKVVAALRREFGGHAVRGAGAAGTPSGGPDGDAEAGPAGSAGDGSGPSPGPVTGR